MDDEITRKDAEKIAETIALMKSGDIPIPGGDRIPFNGVTEDSPRPLPPPRQNTAGCPFYESMTRVASPEWGITIRVWRREDRIPDGPDIDVLKAFKLITVEDDMHSMIAKISALPRIAAIEVTDKNGNGVIVYTEW